MKSIKLAVAAILIPTLLPTLALGQKKLKKATVPAVFGSARFVYVQAMDGEEFDRDLDTADRLAIADLRDALQAWGRYTLTADREKAELVFVVRKGRLASADADGGIGTGQDPRVGSARAEFPGNQRQQGPGMGGQQAPGFGVGAEAGPPEDLLQVCTLTPKGKPGPPLWIHGFANGLDAPRLLLFNQFKETVEKAYPSPAPATPAPPSKP